MEISAPPRLPADLARSCHAMESWQHWLRLSAFLVLYTFSVAAAVGIASRLDSPWMYAANLPFYLIAAAALHGVSLFTHEAVHGTLSSNRILNGVLGAACAIPVWQNYSAYRVLHLRHHQHLGDEGDPDHYANYTRWTWLVFGMNWARLLVGYPIYLIAIPILGFKHGTARARWGIMAEVGATVGLSAMIAATDIPFGWLWHGWVIPMLLINFIVNIRGMSQHTLLEHASDEIQGTRSILTGPLVRFFMCNENYHLEHHLYPGVPWHHLPRVHAALKPDLAAKGAPYIRSYGSFVKAFVKGSIDRSPLGGRDPR